MGLTPVIKSQPKIARLDVHLRNRKTGPLLESLVAHVCARVLQLLERTVLGCVSFANKRTRGHLDLVLDIVGGGLRPLVSTTRTAYLTYTDIK